MIRQASYEDLDGIVATHIQCFPDSFSTVLGSELLKKYYKVYMDVSPELFIVAEENAKIVGFCMGYFMENNRLMDTFYQANKKQLFIKILGLAIRGNKAAWKKIGSFISEKLKKPQFIFVDHRFDGISKERKIDLLSIGVLTDYRGTGIARQLLDRYENAGKSKGREYVVLTVRSENQRGIGFYQKCHFQIKEKRPDKWMYIKELS